MKLYYWLEVIPRKSEESVKGLYSLAIANNIANSLANITSLTNRASLANSLANS